MNAVPTRRRVLSGLVWASLAVMVLSVLVPSVIGVGAAEPTVVNFAAGANPAVTTSGQADPPSVLPTLIASPSVGTEPVAGAFDPANGYVYVANAISNNVSVLNGTTLLTTVALPGSIGSPAYVVYDSVNGYVYVVDRYDFESTGGAVSVLNGTTVLATVPLGKVPDFAAVDPSSGDVYVTNSAGTAVSVVSGTTLVAPVTVGTGPTADVYDPADGYVYVANQGSGNVSVLSGTSLVATLVAGTRPVSIAYDPLDQNVVVASNVSNNVTIYNGLTTVGNLPVGADPTYVGYDPAVSGVWVANTNSSNLTVVSGTSTVATVPVASGPVWAGPGAAGGFSFAVGSLANAVTILQGTSAVGASSVGSVPDFAVADPTNGLTYVLNGGSDTASIFEVAYAVSFNETGLAPAVNWSVTLGASSETFNTSSIGFLEPAGSYAYVVGTPTGYTLVSATPASPLTVTSAPVVVNVTFAPVSSATYTLTFNETGLRGCQGHGGGHSPMGSGQCCMGGTPPAWSVTVDNVTKTTNNTSLSFTEPNGVYNYTIGAPTGYSVSSSVPASPVAIDGANVTVQVTFERVTPSHPLSITFQESGLPYGTVWCVTVNVTQCSSGRQIVFSDLSPGTYAFNVSQVSGYQAQPSSGTVQLQYRSAFVQIRFLSGHHRGC